MTKVNQPSTSFEDDDIPNNDADNFRTSKVNLDMDLNDRSLRPEQIASLFIEVAQRAEKCVDFQICAWIEKYEALRRHPNFTEAALLISSASQIYGRKVDYFESMVLQMVGAARDEKKGKDGEADQTKVVRKSRKKFRTNTIADSFSEAKFIVNELHELPSVKLTEIIKKKKMDFDSHWEKFKASQCRFLKNKKNKLVVSKKMTKSYSEVMATNATFGKTHFYDYDGEEVVGTKAEFRCFSNFLNDDCGLISGYDFTKYFEHVDVVNQEEERRTTASRQESARRFKFYMSNDYLKQQYGIEVDTCPTSTTEDEEITKNLSLEHNISEFSDMISADSTLTQLNDSTVRTLNKVSSIVSDDSAYQSFTGEGTMNLDTIRESDESGQDVETDVQINQELTEYNLAMKSLQEQGLKTVSDPDNHSVSHDTGISSPSIQSPMHLSETASNINFDMFLQPGSSSIFQPIRNTIFKAIPLVKHNFFELPEQRFRRKCVFALPKDDFKLRFNYMMFKKDNLITSTPNKAQVDDEKIESSERKRKAEDQVEGEPDQKRLEYDPDLMTDDEDSLENKNDTEENSESKDVDEGSPENKNDDENLSTPERIRRAAEARLSRDSGIVSPMPDETLTITISEMPQDQPEYQEQASEMQNLVEKVNRWHQYLKPILKESQKRSEFDIHECGTEVLETFDETSGQQEASFSDVMSTNPGDHIARYFLAVLMLVNTGNIDLRNENGDIDRPSDPSELHLKLKSRVRLHKEIDNMDDAMRCIRNNSGTKGEKRRMESSNGSKSKRKKQHKIEQST